MKRKLKVLTLGVLFAFAMTMFGCGGSNEPTQETAEKDDVTFNVMAMTGPTGMGMVQLMDNAENGKTEGNYVISLAGAADEISGKLINGEVDIAAVPCNLASVLYNQTKGEIKVAAINTLGVLYILEKGDTIQSVSDLKGKTIVSTGKGTTPEYTLNYLLQENGLDPVNDVNIEYKTEAAEIATAFANGSAEIAMVPQPVATTILSKNEDVRIALDVTEEWEKVQGEDAHQLVTGVIVARSEVIKEHQDAFNTFLDEYKSSIEFTQNNIDESAALIEKYGIVPQAALAKKALPYCNITYIEGDEMQENVNAYLEVLFAANNKAVGGQMPDDAFYYKR